MQIPSDEFMIPFFKENGFVRKTCPHCGIFYWTQDEKSSNCGDAPCCDYDFIENPPVNRKYSNSQMREKFLSFFEKKQHKRIAPYPVVARWRDDLMFTIASIIDFQPYVTDGIIPPPANPLVVSQPCLRFEDIDLVGLTAGRHLTIFEMGGHHAFNYLDGEQVYWKNETVEYHHELVKEIGVPSEMVTYKEGVWSGGGNAGYCLEPCVGGLEISTLVFMQYRVVGEKWEQMPINIVDTGYGIERWTWLSHGGASGFHAIYGPILGKVLNWAGIKSDEKILSELAKYSYMIDSSNKKDERNFLASKVGINHKELEEILEPMESVYAALDHTKAMTFILSEGIVPSNVKEGYLTRMLFRRGYRFLKKVGIEEKISDLVNLQIDFWGGDFPQVLKMKDEILEMIEVEGKKYQTTLGRGKRLVKRYVKKKKDISFDQYVEFYESHGLTPEDVQESANEIELVIPDNFFTRVSKTHLEKKRDANDRSKTHLAKRISEIPKTRLIFYEDVYKTAFDGKVLDDIDDKYVVLDKTIFFAEGGGQISDKGTFYVRNKKFEVVDVKSIDGVLLHEIKETGIKIGDIVRGTINWERRIALMRAHTATHITLGAARRVLGEHTWQAGASKSIYKSRLDVSHYNRITREEIEKIEELANQIVREGRPITCKFMQRDKAEENYGFRLYQGGTVPGKEIRIVDMGDWDVEACGGTHLTNTSETGLIKIIGTERIQDGVERLIYAVGPYALEEVQRRERILNDSSEMLGTSLEKMQESITINLEKIKSLKIQLERLQHKISQQKAEKLIKDSKNIGELKLVYFADDVNIDFLIELGNNLERLESNIVAIMFSNLERRSAVKVGKEAMGHGLHAGKLASKLGQLIGGRGGGAPYFGQGGGGDLKKFNEAYRSMEKAVREQLS